MILLASFMHSGFADPIFSLSVAFLSRAEISLSAISLEWMKVVKQVVEFFLTELRARGVDVVFDRDKEQLITAL